MKKLQKFEAVASKNQKGEIKISEKPAKVRGFNKKGDAVEFDDVQNVVDSAAEHLLITSKQTLEAAKERGLGFTKFEFWKEVKAETKKEEAPKEEPKK